MQNCPAFVKDLRILVEGIPNTSCHGVIETLFTTYPFYNDRASRRAVQQCLKTLLTKESYAGSISYLVERLKAESSKPGLAPSNAFVLVEWGSILLQYCADNSTAWAKWGHDLVFSEAQVLELCVSSKTRPNVKHSALIVTRRALRRLFNKDSDTANDAIEAVVFQLTEKSQPLGLRSATFLGVVAGVCARLPAKKPVLEACKGQYYSFFVREIIGSRSTVPQHVAAALEDLFQNFTTVEDLLEVLSPAFEKALLRAPEVVLHLLPPLVVSLHPTIDLAQILAEHLLKPLLSNIKSQNSVIRNGAFSAFSVLIGRSHDESYREKILAEILTPLTTSKLAGAEQRALHARMISQIPLLPPRSRSVCEKLAQVVTKEPNEMALGAEAHALTHNFSSILMSDLETIPGNFASISDAYLKGLSDKRPGTRKAWALRIGDLLWPFTSASPNLLTAKFVEAIAPKLLDIFDEIVSNPQNAAQSGLLITAYVVTALSKFVLDAVQSEKVKSSVLKAKILDRALSLSPKPSFLLNHRFYTKLLDYDGCIWMIRALEACSSGLSNVEQALPTSDAWVQTLLYLMTAAELPFKVQKQAVAAMSNAYLKRPALIGDLVVQGLWTWYRNVETEERDTSAIAAKTGNAKLHLAVRSICLLPIEARSKATRIESDILQTQLINMLVLCRPEILPKINWIELCLRVGQDPGHLAQSHGDQCLERVEKCRSFANLVNSSPISMIELAANNTAADLAFVAPDTITPLLLERIEKELRPEDVYKYGPTEVAISRTPEGTVFVDVLNKENRGFAVDKSSRDYDTIKWEEEVRRQVAQKRGQEKKLTLDEKARVTAQLTKESAIRQDVKKLERRLKTGIGLVYALAIGPPTDAGMWLGRSLKALLGIITARAGDIVGGAADEAYIACACLVSSRLGALRKFIGIATLRALGFSTLQAHLRQEPLGDLVTRVLYRLRFMSEQRPFDAISLNYIFPLISIILRQNGVGSSDVDRNDEQVTLALEFLSFHTDAFSDVRLPRGDMLTLLVECMQRFSQHYKIIKDCLLYLCRSLAPNISVSEVTILLKGTIVPQSSVRGTVLLGIREDIDLTDLDFSEEILLASHDDVDENARLGQAIWQENALELEPTDGLKLLPYLASTDKQLRRAASKAIAECIGKDTSAFITVLRRLEEWYCELAKPKSVERDEFGMPKKANLADPWEARSGIALAFKSMARIFDSSKLVDFVQFLIKESAVGDRNAMVRDEMIESAATVITIHGAEKVEELMEIFEKALDESDRNSNVSDLVSEAIVILYGALARHLCDGDGRVPKVVRRLLLTLSTPSETVQYAVAGCLPPLIRTSNQMTHEYIQSVLDELLKAKKYAARRGAAYGLAGIVSGKGISALRDFRIMSTLRSAIENKKDQNQRQGALFAYELLSLILGRIFEPYIIQIVPQLLSSFGDPTADIREACLDTSKTCFASLSSYGVKIILPTLLEGLEEQQWRSKKGACDLLGAMAYLDPQQLALSLPDIIPPLTNVLNDSHKEVRASANRSLQRFGEVISNPEVKGLVGILLKALSDPTKYTDDALDSLIKVSFIHYLDSPSLALIVRILERGLGDRSGTKRKSAQIIGSLAHLTERKDLISHLPILVAGLKMAVIDPVPATRATASKALGSLVEKLGEDALPDLIPGLMSTLKSDTGAGDRLGSAQALSEVLAGLGTGRLEEILPTILQNVASPRPAVREGFMSLFIYLPACFGNSFAVYLSKIIPPILAGLADDVESIRETSLRAGRLLVKNFATRAIDLLLPELDRGLADDSHRIRLSSVDLVGHLLFNLTGISGKTEQDEEDGAAEAGQSLLEVLGEEKRNKILSSLYICRCDTSGLVRNAAINVWKALVATPRTLKELVPTLTQLLIRRLASSNMEQKVIAGNALSELIRKAGEGVLASLLPTLEESLQTSTDTDNKQGICIALREIISSAAPETLEEYEKTLISVVRVALVDPNDEVREAAAEAFTSLQKIFGKKAVDQVLPHLLNLLRTESEADTALSALLTLLTDNTRSNVILPNLLPTLLVAPITSFNARAIASLSQVAGPAMTRRLPSILNTLMDNLVTCKDDELKSNLEDSFDAILISVDEFDGLNTAMSTMLALVKHHDHQRRAIANNSLSRFFSKSSLDYSRYHPDLIRILLISFDDSDMDVVEAAWRALSELTKRLRKEEMEALVFSTRQILQQVGVPGVNLPGFLLPKGINAILPIFLQGLMNGGAEQRTTAALAISDIIDRTSDDALKPFVTQITGPLIRVVSERSVDVKCAILLTLNNMLGKIPTFLKPFLPQLQRTFAKSLADPSSEVLRSRAAKALGTLITLTPRIDPLIAELVAGSKTSDSGVQNAMLQALYEVVSKAGTNMSELSRNSILGLIDSDTGHVDESMVITNARLLGALIKSLPAVSNAAGLIRQRVLTSHISNSSVLNLNSLLLESPASLTVPFAQETPMIISQGIGSKNTFISDNCVLAAGKYLLAMEGPVNVHASTKILEALAAAMQPGGPVDSRRLALVVIRTVSRKHNDAIKPYLQLLAPPIFASVRDQVIPVKLAAEAAFLAIFSVVEFEGAVFDEYLAGAGPELSPNTKRSMQDYFKRIAMRLGAQARERKEAEGGQGGLGLSNDERDDEREIWSVGKVDLGAGVFSDE